jgi:hypothetical protein
VTVSPRNALKIRRGNPCRFDSGPGHQALSALLVFAVTIWCPLYPVPAHAERLVFVLAGQSNMSGRGLEPMPFVRNASRIEYLPNGDERGVGPGMAFADALLDARPDDTVTLIACGRGSTDLATWRPRWGADTPYGACVARARDYDVTGVLWWSGESDAQSWVGVEWAERVQPVISGLRVDFGDLKLPVIVVALKSQPPPGFPFWGWVRRRQLELKAPHAAVVDSEGVEFYPSSPHATTAGQMEIGRRFAAVMEGMLR